MQPILIIVLATAASVPLGLWLRQNLTALGYRNAAEQDLPMPGPRWWVVWVSILALGSLATVAVLSHKPLNYLPLVPLAVTGPWLSAVDFDVLRVPNRILAPTAVATVLAIGGTAAAAQEWRTIILPAAAAVLTGGLLAAIHFATKGGIGFGDVKLAAVIGLAAGPLGVRAVWLCILAGSIAAIIWAKAVRVDDSIPYGPWLLLGAWLTVVVLAAGQG